MRVEREDPPLIGKKGLFSMELGRVPKVAGDSRGL